MRGWIWRRRRRETRVSRRVSRHPPSPSTVCSTTSHMLHRAIDLRVVFGILGPKRRRFSSSTSTEVSSGESFFSVRGDGVADSDDDIPSRIDELGKLRRFDSAWDLLLSRSSYPPPLSAFAPLIRRYARAGMPSAAIRTCNFFLRNSNPSEDESEKAFLLLIDTLCKEGHVKIADDLFSDRQSSPSISSEAYNIILHGWFRARKLKKAERLWSQMRGEALVAPTVVTYGTLIEGLSRMRRPEQALALLDEMKASNIEPNTIVVNPIVDSLSEARRFKEALALVEKFPLYGLSPNISTYNSLVKGFCKSGDLAGASKMIKEMSLRGISPTTQTYTYFFKHFSTFNKVEEAMNLYTKMVNSGYSLDRLTYHLLIKMLCENRRLELAVQMIGQMNESGLRSDLATNTMLLHLLCRLRKHEEACNVFEEMIKKGIAPQYITYHRLMKELKRLNLENLAKKMSNLMDLVPHSINLPDKYRDKEEDKEAKLKEKVMIEAHAISDALKVYKDDKRLGKMKKTLMSDLENANRLIEIIRRKFKPDKEGGLLRRK